jgi:ParB-like nuclease domain
MKTLVISNLDIGDNTFDSDRGSWNVTRAERDCVAGLHRLYKQSVPQMFAANKNVEVDAIKVDAMVADPARLNQAPPVILAMEDGRAWLIEGHHRVRALHQLGVKECVGYVIEEADGKPYRVFFNGKRVAPWHNKKSPAD